jgi:2-isopropylmalate synthase
VGRTFENVIRINSQSGKGGVAYVMEREYGFSLPREMHPEFSRTIQAISEQTGKEVLPEIMWDAFEREYLKKSAPLAIKTCRIDEQPGGQNNNIRGAEVKACIVMNGSERDITGIGNGPIDAFCKAVKAELGIDFDLTAYYEHALEQGSDSQAVAYIQIRDKDNNFVFGAGVDTNISIASLRAVISAVNRLPAFKMPVVERFQYQSGKYSNTGESSE